MCRPISLLLLVVATITALALSSGCDSEPERAPATALAESFAGPGPAVKRVIEHKRAQLRSVPGREGILAEERRYSLFDEELIIRDFFQDRHGGYFVDVGCAWPIRSNNTYYLEAHLGWQGIGIDALAEYGPAWREKRPRARFFSYLVTDRSKSLETFFRSPNTGLSSTDENLARGRIFGAELEPETLQVESITLDDLLDREGVVKIDLLAMDIEGHEPKALAGFDIDRFQPELVVVEGPIVPVANDRDPVSLYFEEHGYELISKYQPFDAVNRYFKRATTK